MRLGHTLISKSGFISFYAIANDTTIDEPSIQNKTWIKMLTHCIWFKNQVTGVVLRIFDREPQLLFVKRKVGDLPVVFHHTLHFHLQVHFLAGSIQYRK